jgi:hypothetical protein
MKPSAAEFLEIKTPEPVRGCVRVRDQPPRVENFESAAAGLRHSRAPVQAFETRIILVNPDPLPFPNGRGKVFIAEFLYRETVNPFRDVCVLKPEMVNPFLSWIKFLLSWEGEGRG